MSEKTVYDIGTRHDIIEGAPNRTLESAILIMGTKKFRRLPITKLGRIRGILTVTDIIRAIATKGLPDGFNEQISDWMTHEPKTIHPEATIDEAVKKMSEGNFGSLLMVDSENNILTGIVTERDILRHAQELNWADNLEKLQTEYLEQGFVMVLADTSLESAVVEMDKHHTHRILLQDENGELCGILSANDITSLCSREREEISHNANFLKSINASFVATRDVMTIDVSKSISEAVGLMCDRNIGSVPVTKDGKVVGIFSERTLIHYLARR